MSEGYDGLLSELNKQSAPVYEKLSASALSESKKILYQHRTNRGEYVYPVGINTYTRFNFEISYWGEKVTFYWWRNYHQKHLEYLEFTLGRSKGSLYKMRVMYYDNDHRYHIYYGAKKLFVCSKLKDIERELEDKVPLY